MFSRYSECVGRCRKLSGNFFFYFLQFIIKPLVDRHEHFKCNIISILDADSRKLKILRTDGSKIIHVCRRQECVQPFEYAALSDCSCFLEGTLRLQSKSHRGKETKNKITTCAALSAV